MYRKTGHRAKVLGAIFVLPMGLIWTGGTALASAPSAAGGLDSPSAAIFTAHVVLSGSTLMHSFTPQGGTTPMTEPLADPDDITLLGNDIFVGFQNGVGPQGQESSDGNLDSTVVELKKNGDPVAQWDVQGKTDGVTADPEAGDVIATVNEDANSSLYTIDPTAPASAQVTHYNYNDSLPHFGGTDAISIYLGQILISASAPGTSGGSAPSPTFPAVYSVSLDRTTDVATVAPLFFDESTATVANIGSTYGQTTTLMLTDPDSNEVVPRGARFGGDFMLTSQGDQEQIYVHNAGNRHQSLSVLSLSQSVDDTAWPTNGRGTLYSTDSTNDSIDTVRGPFVPNQPVVAATPCGANSAPSTCPAPPSYPANFLATLNPETGQVTPVTVVGATYVPQGGLLFIPAGGRQQY
jgi:hypothetical protein